MKISRKSKISKWIASVMCVVTVLGSFTYTFNKNTYISYAAESISQQVSIGKKTFTASDKMQILEIVPDESLAELGYILGYDETPIQWEDIVSIRDWSKRKEIASEWLRIINILIGSKNTIQIGVSNRWYSFESHDFWQLNESYFNRESKIRIVNESGVPYQFNDLKGNISSTMNIFAYFVFGGYDMCDKISYVVKKASDCTTEDIIDSDLIYLNSGVHDKSIRELYKKMSNLNSKYVVNRNIDKTAVSSNNFFALNEDLSASVAWELYKKVANEDLSIVFDSNLRNNYDENYNLSILYTLVNGADRHTFKEQFWQNENSSVNYNGTIGKVEIKKEAGRKEKLVISYKNKENDYKEIQWKLGCLAYIDEIKVGENKYFNEGTMSPNINKNVFCYNGDNIMTVGFIDDSLGVINYEGGTTFTHAFELYGNDNSKISITDIMMYILGVYRYEKFSGTIRVLEIEPSGAYKYNNGNLVNTKKILDYFGYHVKGITQSNCNDYVKVTSVSSNGFIGMTEEVKNNYDLVIISDYNPKGYIDTKITSIYANQGPEVVLTNYNNKLSGGNNTVYESFKTALSGNDFTLKAVDKITDYIKSGKPLILADSIYNGDETVVSSGSNLLSLSYDKLKSNLGENALTNIISENDISDKKLVYYESPELTVSDNFKYNVDNDGVVKTNVDKSQLSELNFTGKVSDISKNYYLKVYVDKDANGLFIETDDDENELLYNNEKDYLSVDENGNFSVKLQKMSEDLRGYLGWKAVLIDADTGISDEDKGAFIVEYDEITPVKVLQIIPEPSANTNTPITLRLDNKQFLELFSGVESTTGLDIKLTVMTITEFEDLYAASNFKISTDKNGNKVVENDLLTKRNESGYDMVVMGFSDAYSYNDISNDNGALDNIKYYIEMGNSVLMSHDLISFASYSDKNLLNHNVNLNNVENVENWSYNISSSLRQMVGMDRYGASTGMQSTVPFNQGYSNIFLMQNGGSKAQTKANIKLYTDMNYINDNLTTTTVKKLNEGQITQYPYVIDENLTVANTHTQYYQLDLESQGDDEINDVVVWYTLDSNSNSSYYNLSGQDALNNYYIYSKGNITYSGAGHEKINSDSELKLFVNTIIRAIGAGNNLPYVEFEKAVKVNAGQYEQYVRDEDLANKDKPIPIYFTPADEDMSGAGKFKEGYVFWDTNGNSIYDIDDILVKEYSSKTGEYLVNGNETIIDLNDEDVLKDEPKNKAAILEALENNKLTISVQAVDSKNGVGVSTINLICRKYFQLN